MRKGRKPSSSGVAPRLPAGWPPAALLVALSLGACDPKKDPAASRGESQAREAGSPAGPAAPRPAGHQRMVALLADIAARTPAEHPFLGEGKLPELRARLSSLSASAEPAERWDLRRQIGMEELRLGRTEKALEELRAALQLLPQLQGKIERREAIQTAFQLGLAYMRWGETQNCVAHHTIESCLLPIQGSGVHVRQEGSRQAISLFTQVLAADPGNASARWLLNIAWMTVGGHPDSVPEAFRIAPETFASEEPFPRFPDAAPRLGLNTFNLSGGAIADDFDNDGDLDLMVSTFDTSGRIKYWRHNADGTFTDRAPEAGLEGLLGGLNMVQADFDNDGHLDFYVIRGAWIGAAGRHPDSLVRNLGDGTFADVTFEAGLGEAHYPSQTAAWGDYDLDGDLDLYVGNETGPTQRSPCQLFRNEGNGKFTDVAAGAGVENYRFTKGVVWGDYDGDRRPDLYVSNLGEENRLYHNNGDGTFTDVAPQVGVTGPIRSFPVWFWDFNQDGALDIFVSSYWPPLEYVAKSYMGLDHKAELACLYQGDGKGGFRNVAREQNLRRVTLPMGSNFGDLDNDGFPDFYIGTGFPGYEGLMPNVLYHNRGGTGFSDVTTAAGVGHLQKGHAIAFADFDNDGDLDLFSQMGGAYRGDGFWNVLFENPGFGRQWLGVKLVGKHSNRSAIGVRVRADIVEDGKARAVYANIGSGGSFGGNPLRAHLGLGKAARVERLEVFWPVTGETQSFTAIPADQIIEITEGAATYRPLPSPPLKFP